jgi:hypothetical protein
VLLTVSCVAHLMVVVLQFRQNTHCNIVVICKAESQVLPLSFLCIAILLPVYCLALPMYCQVLPSTANVLPSTANVLPRIASVLGILIL